MSEVSERFPKGISVEDLISGKVDVDLVLEEMNEVKSIVSNLRDEMIKFLRLMADLSSESRPAESFQGIQLQVQTLKSEINTYADRYSNLSSIIKYSQEQLGVEDEVQELTQHGVAFSESSDRKSPPKRRYARPPSSNVSTPNMSPGVSPARKPVSRTTGSANQPILL